MPVRSDHSFVHNLTLVRGCKAALPGKFTKLLMSEPHDYRGVNELLNKNNYKTSSRAVKP
jgi:hypothetical protein